MTEIKDNIQTIGFKSDRVLELILANKDNEFILVDLINALLRGETVIKSAFVQNKEDPKAIIEDKDCMLNILCTDKQDNIYNIEMQGFQHNAILEGFILYKNASVARQLIRKSEYGKVEPIISILLLDFNFFDDSIFHDILTHRSDVRPEVDLSDVSETHLIELQKFQCDELITDYDKWLYVFNNLEQLVNGEIPIPQSIKDQKAISVALERVSNLKKQAKKLDN